MILVLHNSRFLTDSLAGTLPDPACCLPVAAVLTDRLDSAFRLTQNLERPWTGHPAVQVLPAARDGARSTSAGDVLIDAAGAAWVASDRGFLPLPPRGHPDDASRAGQ